MISPKLDNANADDAGIALRRKRFTRDDYHRMFEAGVLTEDDRVELINGEIVNMAPIGPEHASATDKLAAFFIRQLDDRYICRVQGPQATDEVCEPQPDFQILRARPDYYKGDHPAPEDVLLVIEVAKTSSREDRGTKMKMYASAGIAEYWVADLDRKVMIVHRNPDTEVAEYRVVEQYDATRKIAPTATPECVLDLAWLFG